MTCFEIATSLNNYLCAIYPQSARIAAYGKKEDPSGYKERLGQKVNMLMTVFDNGFCLLTAEEFKRQILIQHVKYEPTVPELKRLYNQILNRIYDKQFTLIDKIENDLRCAKSELMSESPYVDMKPELAINKDDIRAKIKDLQEELKEAKDQLKKDIDRNHNKARIIKQNKEVKNGEPRRIEKRACA